MSTFNKKSTRDDVRKLLEYTSEVLVRYTELDSLRREPTIDTFTSAIAQMKKEADRYTEPYRLAVVGDFKVGKSSLINALLAHKNLVAEGVVPTTGAVTELWYSDSPSGRVLNNQGEILYEGDLETAASYADQRTQKGKESSGRGIRVILMKPAEVLRNLTIIDTPGLGANLTDDKVTLDSLHLADAAILVLGAGKLGGERSIEMAERLRSANKQMSLVITRADLDPSNGKRSAKEMADVFNGVIDGPPIIFSAKKVQEALEELTASFETRDEAKAAKARIALETWGHSALTERILEGHLSSGGSAGIARAKAVLGELRKRSKALNVSAAREQDVAAKVVETLTRQLDETDRIVAEVLDPKVPYIEYRIEDIVDQYVGKLLDMRKEAIELLVDDRMDAGVSEGIKALWAMVNDDYERKRNREMERNLKSLFPDEVGEIMAQDIERAVNRLLKAEWKAVVKEIGAKNIASSVDTEGLMKKVDEHLKKVLAALATDLAAGIALFFVQGGVILNILEMMGALLLTRGQIGKEEARTALVKRKAGLLIKGQRVILRDKLSNYYRQLNKDVHQMVVQKTRVTSSEQAESRDHTNQALVKWRDASKDLSTILEAAMDIEQGGWV
jgi:GTP-binding protein EngB required for normal cell division